MKKILLFTFIAFLAFSNNTNAQVGLKMSYNLARQTGYTAKYPKNLSDHVGWYGNAAFGAFVERDFLLFFDLRAGLDYSPKGSKIKQNETHVSSRINYLELPLLAKIRIGSLYALGGFYGALALNGKVTTTTLGVKQTNSMDFSGDDLNRLDYGVKFGAGVQVRLFNLRSFAQVEYSYGIANISQIPGVKSHNSVLAISLGVIMCRGSFKR